MKKLCRLAVVGLTDQQLHQRVDQKSYQEAAHIYEMQVRLPTEHT